MEPLPRWVTPNDIRDAAYGMTFTDEEMGQLEKLIIRAERMIASRVPRLEQRLGSGVLSEDTVKAVVEGMVLRVIRNPDGVQSDSTGGVSTAYWRSSGSGVLELLREDLAVLMPPQRRVGSIKVNVPAWRLP